jgi:glycopeptide antibiotics resistance protein
METTTRPIAGGRWTSAQPDSRGSDERACSLAAAGVAAFIVYGSLLPFDFVRLDTVNPVSLLGRIRPPWPLASVADLFVNIATAIPLGFFLAGALRSGPRQVRLPATALVVGFVSAGLATVVEILQVFSATRQSAWHDVLAQFVGSGLGMLVWILAGPSTTRWVRGLAAERRASDFAARLLQSYLPFYLFIQLTPIAHADLDARYHEQISWLPVAYHFAFAFPDLHNFAAKAVINIPIGALAVLGWVRRGTHRRTGLALVLGVSAVIVVEVTQGFIWSKYAGAMDILAGAIGVAIGTASALEWYRIPAIHGAGRTRLLRSWFLVAAVAWTLILMAQNWQPFDFQFTAEFAATRYPVVQLIPFKAYYPGYALTPLIGLHEMVARCLAGVPLGLLLRIAGGKGRGRRLGFDHALATLATATVVFVAIEIGQVFLPIPYEFPDVTDVVLGVAGAAIGYVAGAALVCRRIPSGAARSEQRIGNVASGYQTSRDTARTGGRFSIPS